MRTRTLAVLCIAAVALASGLVRPATAANVLCPQVCLTGGILSGTRASVAVMGASVAADESRTYSYGWAAVDVNGAIVGLRNLVIKITATGSDSNGVWNGTGTAKISNPATGASATVPVTVNDTGSAVVANGNAGGRLFALAANDLGLGTASYESSQDPDWVNESGGGDEDCDAHSNGKGLGHVIGKGKGHDCDEEAA